MSYNDSELFESITDPVSGNIECDFKALLGSGGFGSVFFGKYNGKEVAIKRILVEMAEIREIKAQMKLDHDNILKIVTVKEDDIFRYIVLELCAGTLRDVCEKSFKGPDLPSDVNVLYDIAKGLNYIHSTKLVHRDIKPDNILISLTTPSRIKISDFGLSKETSTNHTFELSTPLRGTLLWMAPELQQIIYRYNNGQSTIQSDTPRKDSNKSDIFSAGCVYFYFVTRGVHPFGGDYIRIMQNIRNNTQIYGLVKEHFASNIIKSMTEYEPNKRMSLEQVMEILVELKEKNYPSSISADQDFPLISLLLKLQIRETFKEVEHSLEENFGMHQILSAKFHPIDPVLACGLPKRVVLLKGADHSVLFSDWEKEQEFNLKSSALFLEWNVDGTQLAVGQRATVVVWRYPTGEILCEMKHSKFSSELRFVWSPFSCDVLATFYWEGKQLLVWNSSSEKHLTYEFDSVVDDIMSIQWISKNQIACSYEKGTIDIYQVDDGSNIVEFEHGEDVVWCMAWNEEQKYLATGSADKTVKIWSLENDDPVYTLNVGSDCFSLAWRLKENRSDSDADSNSIENPLIAGGLGAGSVFIWDFKSPAVPRYLEGLSGLISLVLFSSDQRFLVSCSSETGITVWSANKNWEKIYTLPIETQLSTLSWDAISNKFSIGNQGGEKLRVIECVVEEEL